MPTLIVDCQILQTAAYDRGMGKYTVCLLEALSKQAHSYDKIVLVYNKNLPLTPKRRAKIKNRVAGSEIVSLNLPIDISLDIDEKYSLAKTVITEYIIANFSSEVKIDYLIMAPFFVDFPAVFPANKNVRKFSIVYDFTPQKIWHTQKIFPDNIYFKHIQILLEADHLFSISHAVKDDTTSLVGIPQERITSINGAPYTTRGDVNLKISKALKTPYILLPTGPIIHKNNENAVRGFTEFNRMNQNKYTLYITSKFDEQTKNKLLAINKDIEFTGNISDDQLAAAYKSASVVLFASLAEGLGMPILEAAQYETPIACSDIPVFKELSANAFYYFNPKQHPEITKALFDAARKTNWSFHQEAYKSVRTEYTWEHSAQRLLRGMETNHAKSKQMEKLHIVMPNPGEKTAAAYLGEHLYPALASYFDLSVEFPKTKKIERPSYLSYVSTTKSKDRTLRIQNRRRGISDILKRRYPVNVVVDKMNSKSSVDLSSAMTITDDALGLSGWVYFDNKNDALEVTDILAELFREEMKI